MNSKAHLAAIALAPVLLAAANAAHAAPATSDPLEAANRRVFALNRAADRSFIRPLAVGYKRIVPAPVRSALHNVVSNLNEPSVLVNDGLQGRADRAARTLARFALNSTIGLGGAFDVAAAAGMPHKNNDFGATLARYGVKSGPFLVLPVLGPTTVRDAAAAIAGVALNPLTYVGFPGSAEVGVTQGVEPGLTARADLDGTLALVNASATDPYAYIRSLYLQSRTSEIAEGRISVETLPDFDDGANGHDQNTAVSRQAAPALGAARDASGFSQARLDAARPFGAAAASLEAPTP